MLYLLLRPFIVSNSSFLNVLTKVPATETIIVGKVPYSYLNVPEEEMMNLILPE